MPSDLDLEQKARELVQGAIPCKVYEHEEGCTCVQTAILAALREIDAAAEKRTAQRCAERLERPSFVPPSLDERYSEGWYDARRDFAEAIRAEFLGGSKP